MQQLSPGNIVLKSWQESAVSCLPHAAGCPHNSHDAACCSCWAMHVCPVLPSACRSCCWSPYIYCTPLRSQAHLLQPAGHSVGALLAALQRHVVQAHICSMRLAACIWQQQHPPQRLHPPLLYRVRPRLLSRLRQPAASPHSLPDGLVQGVHAATSAQDGPQSAEAVQGKVKPHGQGAAGNPGKDLLGKPRNAEQQEGRQLALPPQAEFCLPLRDPVGRLPGTGQVALQRVGLQELLLQAGPAATAAPAQHAVAPPVIDPIQESQGGLPGAAAPDVRQAEADPGVAALQAGGHKKEPDGATPASELGPVGIGGEQTLADPVIVPSQQNGAANAPKRKRPEGSPGLDDGGPAAAKRRHVEPVDELTKRKRSEGSPGLYDAGPAAAKRRHVEAVDGLANGHSSQLAAAQEQPAVTDAASDGAGAALPVASADGGQPHLQLRVSWSSDGQWGGGCRIHCHPDLPLDMLRSLQQFVGEDLLQMAILPRQQACLNVLRLF